MTRWNTPDFCVGPTSERIMRSVPWRPVDESERLNLRYDVLVFNIKPARSRIRAGAGQGVRTLVFWLKKCFWSIKYRKLYYVFSANLWGVHVCSRSGDTDVTRVDGEVDRPVAPKYEILSDSHECRRINNELPFSESSCIFISAALCFTPLQHVGKSSSPVTA